MQFEPSQQLNGETSGEKSVLDLPRTQPTPQRSSIARGGQNHPPAAAVAPAGSTHDGGVTAGFRLNPLLVNLQCWVAPQQFALGNAAQAFDTEGVLQSEVHRQGVQAVVEQVLRASARLGNNKAI